MSRVTQITDSVVLQPTGYTGASGLSSSSSYPYTNGQNSTSNTSSYARLNPSSTNSQGYIYYTFTVPSLPSSATITSVTAQFRARFSNSSGATGNAQLYRSTTAVGSATSVSGGTTNKVYDIASASGWTVSNISNLRLRVNVTKTSNSRYLYFYGADVTINYSYNQTLYSITTSVTDNGGTVSPASTEVIAGKSYTISLEPNNAGVEPYKVLDNNVDVTSQVVEAHGEASTYTVTKASGASYEFVQSGNSYVSNNKGKATSAAVSVITLTIKNNAAVTINAVASSEASYDYGYLSNIGSTFSTSAGNESSYKWRGAGSDSATVDYGTLTPGTYQIYAKYYKDTYKDSGSDTFTFTVNISETVPPATGFAYTISNVQADHTITVQFNPNTQYNITGTVASSLSVSPSLPTSVYEGYDFDLGITPTLPGTITVVDNNTTAATYTIPVGDLSAKTYTIQNVRAAHTLNIQFTELAKYNITGTVASSLSINPTLPVNNKYRGTSQSFTITPTLPGTIVIVDNGSTAATYTIPVGDLSAQSYDIENIQAAHTLNIQFTELAKYNITGTVGSGISVSPSLPINNKYQGTSQTFTITPTEAGIITVTDNDNDTQYIIPRDNVHSVEYTISNISAAHVLSFTFEPLPQYQISGTVQSGLSISPSLPQTLYAGDDFTLTITPSAGGKIIVNDNGQDYIYTVSRTDIQPVYHYIGGIDEAHTLSITYEAPIQYTVSGTVGSGVSISPSLPQPFYTGDNLALTITPSDAGIITVVDNNKTTTYQIAVGQVAAVIYNINGITESHTLAITFEALPQYTISVGPNGIASGVTVSPSLPVTKYLGQSQTFTITPSTSGTTTVIEDNVERAIHYITPSNVHAVEYSITNIAASHALEVKYSALPQFTATASLTGTGTLSSNSTTEYAGNDVTFTITGVPSSNILIVIQDGKNVSKKAVKNGTTYTYTFTLIENTNIVFTSKVPQNVTISQGIDTFGTISPDTEQSVLEGSEYTLQITPSDYQTNPPTKPLSVSDNCVEVVDQLELKQDTANPTLTATGSSYTSIGSQAGLWANAVGKTAENPSTTSTTSNSYSSGSGTTGTVTYTFSFSSIPSNAVIRSVSCNVRGHAESTTNDSTHFCKFQLYKNETAVGTAGQFTTTSNTVKSIPNCGTWTRSELNDLTMRVTVGYYGGMIYGISLIIEYEVNAFRYYYTVPVYESKEIIVKYTPDFYVKVNNQWKGMTLTSLFPKVGNECKSVSQMYVKINGTWKQVG